MVVYQTWSAAFLLKPERTYVNPPTMPPRSAVTTFAAPYGMETKKLATPRPTSAAVVPPEFLVSPASPSAAKAIEFTLKASTRLNTTSCITLLAIQTLLCWMFKRHVLTPTLFIYKIRQ